MDTEKLVKFSYQQLCVNWAHFIDLNSGGQVIIHAYFMNAIKEPCIHTIFQKSSFIIQQSSLKFKRFGTINTVQYDLTYSGKNC